MTQPPFSVKHYHCRDVLGCHYLISQISVYFGVGDCCHRLADRANSFPIDISWVIPIIHHHRHTLSASHLSSRSISHDTCSISNYLADTYQLLHTIIVYHTRLLRQRGHTLWLHISSGHLHHPWLPPTPPLTLNNLKCTSTDTSLITITNPLSIFSYIHLSIVILSQHSVRILSHYASLLVLLCVSIMLYSILYMLT